MGEGLEKAVKKGPFYRKYIRPVKHTIGFWIISAVIGLVRLVPRGIALWKASFLGGLYYSLSRKDRGVASKNIEIAFPEIPTHDRDALARECFRQSAMNLVDIVRAKAIVESEPPLWRIEGEDIVRAAIHDHGGGIVLSGHIGCFELIAGIWKRLGVDVAVVGRKLYDERIDSLLVQQRESMGVENIPSDAHPKKVLSMVKSGYLIGTLIDTYTKSVDGRSAPFFGREVRTISAPAGLARVCDRPLLPMSIFREGKYNFLLKVWPLIEIPKTNDKNADIDELLRRANEAIEAMILFRPSQWIWFHDRFRE